MIRCELFLLLFISPKLLQPPIQGADDGFVGDLDKASLSVFRFGIDNLSCLHSFCTLSDKKNPSFFLGLFELQLLFFCKTLLLQVQLGRSLVDAGVD